ncbi:MAG: hypothetical protein WA112_12455 [Rugosibacter sp.]|nr:hypothetical protein [Rugosibacter sp.]
MKKLNLCIVSTLFASSLALAQTATQTTTSTTASQPATATVPSNKLTTEFSGWAGSPENADALVNGLRTGTSITLTTPGTPETTGTAITTTTFSPTTKPMGYGNIRIALRLAQEQLASQGISNPTPAELQGALVGMPGSSTQGILQMRAAGMGWGQIANTMGVKLGAVVSGKQPATPTTAYGRSTSAGGAQGAQTRKGVVSASGNASAGRSSGITSGAGVSSQATTGLGQTHGQGVGAGVVNAGGGKAAGLAGSHAGGNGKGGGKP